MWHDSPWRKRGADRCTRPEWSYVYWARDRLPRGRTLMLTKPGARAANLAKACSSCLCTPPAIIYLPTPPNPLPGSNVKGHDTLDVAWIHIWSQAFQEPRTGGNPLYPQTA